jgi:peptidoglycan L-alanyl-D-glutamate endopeptidase CwlK
MASRSIDALAPIVKSQALAFMNECRACGLGILIYCTLRSLPEQTALYASGRTKPGQILTHAKPGKSLHNPDANGDAWAFDAVPVIAGKPLWDDAARIEQMGICGESVGLEWAGRWRGAMRERVHFQGVKS